MVRWSVGLCLVHASVWMAVDDAVKAKELFALIQAARQLTISDACLDGHLEMSLSE